MQDFDFIEEKLRGLGLTDSEVKVYLTLLQTGPNSAGRIVLKSGTANSKVYEVLEKLISKGMVSHYLKEGVKYYKASSPKMILDYIEEEKAELDSRKKEIEQILPNLLAIRPGEEATQASILQGYRGVRNGFIELVDELEKGEEVHIMGVHDFGKKFLNLALFFQKIRSEKGIKAKFLVNKSAEHIAREFKKYPPTEIKFLPANVNTPAIFLIYKDKVIINIAEELTFFVLKNKRTAESFEAYFQSLWA